MASAVLNPMPRMSRAKPIGVFGHDLDGVRAVGLEDTNRPGRTDAMAVQEDHDLANDLLLGPGIGDALGADRADAGHLSKPVGLGLDDVEHLLPKRLDHLLGIDGPDAADHSRAQILLDAVDRSRGGGAHEARLELLAMGVIVDPVARGGNPFTGGDDRGMADDSDQVAMAARLDPQNAEATFSIVECDPLDKAGENFLSRGFLLESHRRFKRDCSSNYRQRITLEEVGQGICKAKPLRFQYASEAS